jgi:hypothetical protein
MIRFLFSVARALPAHLHLFAYLRRQLRRRLQVLSNDWEHPKDDRGGSQDVDGDLETAHVRASGFRVVDESRWCWMNDGPEAERVKSDGAQDA